MKKLFASALVLLFLAAFPACTSPAPTDTPPPESASTPTATAAAPSPTPYATPTPTPSPSPTPETPDVAGSGDVLFDIYKSKAARDINFDGSDETITFTAGAGTSSLTINGVPYDVPRKSLAQLFAITDVNKTDKILEICFCEQYDPGLADSEKPFSYLYWWNGSKLISMGGLMDVAFAGDWRPTFSAVNYFDGKGQVTCLTDSKNLTDIWYMGHYKPSGTERKLAESLYAAKPVNEVGVLKCKKPCLIQVKIEDTYFNSAYDYYWIPTLAPTTAGRVPNVDTGIKIIEQPGNKLQIVAVYGKKWFKVKTFDGLQGWIKCDNKKVGAYNFTMGWTADDMFDGIVIAG